MRVLHVYKDLFPPRTGGVERYIHDLCIFLRERGHDARVLIASSGFSLRSRSEQRDGIPVTVAPSFGRILSNPVLTGFAAALRRERCDIIHFHHPLPAAALGWALARPSAPFVVTYHSDIVRQAALVPLIAPLLWRFLRSASAVLATSPVYAETSPFLSRLGNVRVLPPGVDRRVFSPGPSSSSGYFLFVGRFRSYKGLPVLIRAWRGLSGLRLVLVGGGPMEKGLRRLAAELSVEADFAGEVDDADLVDLYRGARAFVLPSVARSEAYGLAQLEAMACGVPVVSTLLPSGVPWVNRDGETGLLVEPGDQEGLSSAVRSLCDDALRERLSRGALARAAELDASRHFTDVEQAYAGIIGR